MTLLHFVNCDKASQFTLWRKEKIKIKITRVPVLKESTAVAGQKAGSRREIGGQDCVSRIFQGIPSQIFPGLHQILYLTLYLRIGLQLPCQQGVVPNFYLPLTPFLQPEREQVGPREVKARRSAAQGSPGYRVGPSQKINVKQKQDLKEMCL